jgi:ectoine hydroxylase
MTLGAGDLETRVAFYHEFGYVVIENAVPADDLSELRAAVERGERDGLPGRNLLANDPAFERMIDGHAGFPVLERLLGDDIQLLAMDLRTCPPGGGEMGWHADHPFYAPGVVNTVNTALYLDALTPDNGALRVVPKSHRGPFTLDRDEWAAPVPGELIVTCPPGTMVVFSDALWHRTGRNVTDRPRRGIFTYYGHFWHKPCAFAENPRPFHRMTEYLDGKGERRAQLLGLHKAGSEFNHYE